MVTFPKESLISLLNRREIQLSMYTKKWLPSLLGVNVSLYLFSFKLFVVFKLLTCWFLNMICNTIWEIEEMYHCSL
jgi:hypothetical protein